MKKSNCKGRLLGIAGMCIAIATLGFAYASIAVASGWFPFKLPGSGLTNIFMNEKIAALTQAVEAFAPKSLAEIEDFRIKMVGKKGEMTALMEEFKSVAPELKREFGQKLNA